MGGPHSGKYNIHHKYFAKNKWIACTLIIQYWSRQELVNLTHKLQLGYFHIEAKSLTLTCESLRPELSKNVELGTVPPHSPQLRKFWTQTNFVAEFYDSKKNYFGNFWTNFFVPHPPRVVKSAGIWGLDPSIAKDLIIANTPKILCRPRDVIYFLQALTNSFQTSISKV